MSTRYYPSLLPEPIIVEQLKVHKLPPYNEKHFHHFYELYFLIEGDVDFFIDNKTYHVSPFNVIFVSPYTLHKSFIQEKFPYERFVIYFTKDVILSDYILNLINQSNKVISIPASASKSIFKSLCLMAQEDNHNDELHYPYLQSLLNEMLITILRNSESVTAEKTSANFEEVIRYIKENFRDSISLKTVADKFFLNSSYLSRSFKKNTGFTYIEYLNYQRVFYAQELLKNTRIRIMDIAMKSGFESNTHFGRVFKQLTGVSPSEYRKQLQNQADEK